MCGVAVSIASFIVGEGLEEEQASRNDPPMPMKRVKVVKTYYGKSKHPKKISPSRVRAHKKDDKG